MRSTSTSSSVLPLGALASCVLVAALGTQLSVGRADRPTTVLAAALLALLPGALLGALELAFAGFVLPSLRGLVAPLQLQRFVERDRAAPRAPVIGLHAWALAGMTWVVCFGVSSWLCLARLRSVQDDDLRTALSVVGVVGLAAISGSVASMLFFVFRKLLARVDARVALPLPPSPALRATLWFALPVLAVSVAGVLVLEPALGLLASPLWLLAALCVQVCLQPVTARLVGPVRGPARGWRTALVLAALAVAGLALADRLLARAPGALASLEQAARPGALLLRAARGLTDVDGDGSSAVLGGGDCAPWSAARGPGAREIPANGVDEDCDGKDAKKGSLPQSPRYYGSLPAALVQKYDIVWFVVDAVRADHTSLLGYRRPTTPNLQALAKESQVFSRAFSQSSATMLSFPSLLSGIDPGRLKWVQEKERLQISKDQRVYLSDVLGKRGYTTGFIGDGYLKGRLPGLMRGWSWTTVPMGVRREPSTTAVAAANGFIARAQERSAPFFLLTYLQSPHAPYDSYGVSYPKFSRDEQGRYDQEIHNADRYIAVVLDMLQADPERWAKTIVIVTADHGEEFHEHGGANHAATCFVESLHVPLLVRIPGLPAARIDHDVALVDIVPTLIELTGSTADAPAHLDGSSLLLAVRAPARLPVDRPLFCSIVSQKGSQGRFMRRSVMSERYKLIRELRANDPPRLYDIEADPHEKSPLPLTGQNAAIEARLSEWLRLELTGNLADIDLNGPG